MRQSAHRATLGLTAALATGLLWPGPASTQPAAPPPPPTAAAPPPVPLPSEEQLDYLLAANAWGPLGTVLSRPMTGADLDKALRWMRSNIEFGGGPVLGFLYARDLWALGDHAKVADPAKDFRITAASVVLYTYVIIQLAGTRCQDEAAPSQHIQQLLDTERPVLDFLAKSPKDVRAKAIEAVLALEQRTAPFRKDDAFVCSTTEQHPPASPTAPPPSPTASPPTNAPKPAATPSPAFVDPAISRAREAKLRAGLPASLRRLAAL